MALYNATGKSTPINNKDLYKQALEETSTGTTTPTNTAASTVNSLGDLSDQRASYYESLKNENYRTLLDKEVSLANARQRASMLTQNTLNASGFGSSGYGSTNRTGLENSYINALQNVGTDYQQQNAQIEQQEYDENRTQLEADFQNLTSVMSSATSMNELNSTLATYGLGTVDESGNFTFNNDELSRLDTSTRNQILAMYNLYNSQLSQADAEASEYDFLANSTLDQQAYKDYSTAIANVRDATGGSGSNISDELEYIFSEEYMTNATDGQVVKLVNGNDDKKYAYMIYHNGAWYQTDVTTYNSATNKETIRDPKKQQQEVRIARIRELQDEMERVNQSTRGRELTTEEQERVKQLIEEYERLLTNR